MAASASASASASTSIAANPNEYKYDVFINHSGPDVKNTFASVLYRRLLSHRLTTFLDRDEVRQVGDLLSQIESALKTASLHVAIFSPGYAKSTWCLNELVLMLESGATIIPVYYRVKPAELRWTEGIYAQALHRLEKTRIYDPQTQEEEKLRHDRTTIDNWRNALSRVSSISGFELDAYNNDEGVLLEKVVEAVLKKCEKPPLNVFINHRGPDVKQTFASYLYHRLHYCGMQVFLDRKGLQGGDNLFSTIEAAIGSASVHVAIFSPRYAESIWCLKELVLMVESGKTIIPVFYKVKPADVRWIQLKRKVGWTKVKNGKYAEDLDKHERKNRSDPLTIDNWRNALNHVANIKGFELDTYSGDEEGALLEGVVNCLMDLGKNNSSLDEGRRV